MPPGYLGGLVNGNTIKLAPYGTSINERKGAVYYGKSGIQNLIPILLEPDLVKSLIPYVNSLDIMERIGSTRLFADEKFDLIYPFSARRSYMYVQIINSLEVDGTIQYSLRSIDSTDKYGKHFWLPKHVRKAADKYLNQKGNGRLRNLRLEKMTKADIDFMIVKFNVIDKDTADYLSYSQMCPRVNFSIPMTANNMMLKQYGPSAH